MESGERQSEKRKRRWLRLLVWWVVGTVVIVGVEVGAVWWAATHLPTTQATHGGYWLVWRTDRSEPFSSHFLVAARTGGRTIGVIGPIYFDVNYAKVPPIIWTSDGSLDALSGEEIAKEFPDHQGAAQRVQSVLGSIRHMNGSDVHVKAIDIACAIPIGMLLSGEPPPFGQDNYTLPRALRANYPLIICLEFRKRHVMVHWAGLLLAAIVSASLVGCCASIGPMKRVMHRR